MVFKFLSKPKAKIEIKSENKVIPGALLPVEIRLEAQEEIKARELRVELVGEETYFVKETHRDSQGHTSTRVVQKTGTIANITNTIATEPVLLKGLEQHWNISLQLPAEAPPSCRGQLVNIRWKIKVTLDVPNQPDQSQEIPLQVLHVLPQDIKITTSSGEQVFTDFIANLEVAQIAFPDDTLIGRLTMQIKDKLNVQGIRVELVKVEDAGARDSSEVTSKIEVSGSSSFNPFESPSFDFSLNIPRDAPPTANSVHSSLRWNIKAVIARRLKTDFNMEHEILVYNSHTP
jgi:hypothetical protein